MQGAHQAWQGAAMADALWTISLPLVAVYSLHVDRAASAQTLPPVSKSRFIVGAPCRPQSAQ